MGCWHGHGPWCDGPSPRGWYGPHQGASEWFAEPDWPVRRPERRGRPLDRQSMGRSLEARLAELREEVERIEADLAELRQSAAQAPEDR